MAFWRERSASSNDYAMRDSRDKFDELYYDTSIFLSSQDLASGR